MGLVAVTACLSAAAGCVKTDEVAEGGSREPTVTYVAAKIIPVGKTVRASLADGSITLSEVPGDVLTGDDLDDPRAIECLVTGRSVPAGTLLRRSMFVDPANVGLEAGLTDGTTPDLEC